MSYIDAVLDRKSDQIRIVERVNGKRNLLVVPANYVFYHEDPSGIHRSIFNHTCRRVSTSSGQKFHKLLNEHRDKQHRIFESDINPVFRHLADNYMGADVPKLHVGFFDIEADFDAVRGFAPSSDPFNAVTAISLYRTADETLLTYVLCPPTVALQDAQTLAAQFPNTTMFDDEKALLNAFLDDIDDVDLMSGWNCLPLTQNIWLADHIVPLSEVLKGDMTNGYGRVLDTHKSGTKAVNQIVLENGQLLEASDQHTIPVYCKPKAAYRNASTMLKTVTEMTVTDIKHQFAKKEHNLYLEVCLHSNDNDHYSYRSYMLDNLEAFLEMEDYDICIDACPQMRDKALSSLSPEARTAMFTHSRYISSHDQYPCLWGSKRFKCIEVSDIRKFIATGAKAKFVFQGNRSFDVILTEIIPADVCRVLGFQFTDGTYNRKDKNFTLYSKYTDMLRSYRDIIYSQYRVKNTAVGEPVMANDGCASFDYRRGSVFGLLASMIYDRDWSKTINVKLLSRLSSNQFSSFVSGLIDGDGVISMNSIAICNFDGVLQNLHQLFLWNGIYCSVSRNHIYISKIQINKPFIDGLTILHPIRAERIRAMSFASIKNRANKLLRRLVLQDRVLVRVRDIHVKKSVEMGDIETEKHYFHAAGVRVHNSASYDIPYLINRVAKILGKAETRRFCLMNYLPNPRETMDKFGRKLATYDLVGRAHLDYIDLYRKHNTQQRLSYALNAIAELEVGDIKTPYEGTLDDLYKKDLFKFIEYNRQDVMLMVKIDKKNQFIDLANQIAHANCVLLKTTMGSVALVEQAIINEMHALNRLVPDRKPRDDGPGDDDVLDAEEDDDEDDEITHSPVVGAYVAQPRKGLRDQIGAVDINSLYPSAIRALNMSPETLIGQVRPTETMKLIDERVAKLPTTHRAEAWDGIFCTLEVQHMHDQDNTEVTVDFIDQLTDVVTTKTMTGKQLHDYVFNSENHVCITANGTLFRTDVEGIIPALLAKWYAERKIAQKKVVEYNELAYGVLIDPDLEQELIVSWAASL